MRERSVPLWQLVSIHIAAYGAIALILSPAPWGIAPLLAAPLIWASVVDIERHEIPDLASLWIVLSGLVWLYLSPQVPLWPHLATGAMTGAVFYAIGEVYHRSTGVDGLGMGDAKLVAGLGLWVGPFGMVHLILIASLSALAVIGVSRIGPTRIAGIAFGPFLCLAGWAIWLSKG